MVTLPFFSIIAAGWNASIRWCGHMGPTWLVSGTWCPLHPAPVPKSKFASALLQSPRWRRRRRQGKVIERYGKLRERRERKGMEREKEGKGRDWRDKQIQILARPIALAGLCSYLVFLWIMFSARSTLPSWRCHFSRQRWWVPKFRTAPHNRGFFCGVFVEALLFCFSAILVGSQWAILVFLIFLSATSLPFILHILSLNPFELWFYVFFLFFFNCWLVPSFLCVFFLFSPLLLRRESPDFFLSVCSPLLASSFILLPRHLSS